MTVKLKIFESNLNRATVATSYYPRVQSYNTYSTEEFANQLSINESISLSNVKAVLNAFGSELLKHLCNGHNVKIDGLGTFSLGVSGNVTMKGSKASIRNIHLTKINLLADKSVAQLLKYTKLEAIGDVPQHKAIISIDKAKEIMEELLTTNEVIYASDFADRAHVSTYNANKILKQLVSEGSLIRSGYKRHFVYTKPSAK